MRNPVFGVSDLVRHKPGCTATEDGYRLEISDLERRGICVAKTKPHGCSAALFSHMQKSGFLMTRLKCDQYEFLFRIGRQFVMHQSFEFTAPLGPGNSGAFNFPIFKAPLKSPALPDQICGKIPAKSPRTPGRKIMKISK